MESNEDRVRIPHVQNKLNKHKYQSITKLRLGVSNWQKWLGRKNTDKKQKY